MNNGTTKIHLSPPELRRAMDGEKNTAELHWITSTWLQQIFYYFFFRFVHLKWYTIPFGPRPHKKSVLYFNSRFNGRLILARMYKLRLHKWRTQRKQQTIHVRCSDSEKRSKFLIYLLSVKKKKKKFGFNSVTKYSNFALGVNMQIMLKTKRNEKKKIHHGIETEKPLFQCVNHLRFIFTFFPTSGSAWSEMHFLINSWKKQRECMENKNHKIKCKFLTGILTDTEHCNSMLTMNNER